MARVKAGDLDNITEFQEGIENELFYLRTFQHESEKVDSDGNKKKYTVHEFENQDNQIIQVFGCGVLDHKLKQVNKKAISLGLDYPIKVWITYQGQKEVDRSISQTGTMHEFDVEFDNGQ